MPSSASTRLRLNLQAPGENNNTWGSLLNSQMFQLIDDAVAGRTAFALSGTKTLTSTNFVTNEARAACLDITSGTGGTVTIPGYEKLYLVRNATSGDVTLTTGGSTNATVKSGNVQFVACDGTNVYLAKERDLGSDLLTTSATPTADGHLTRKAYVDGLNTTEHDARVAGDAATLAAAEAYTDATSFAAGSLPGGGSTGQYLKRIAGPSATWADPFPQVAGGAYDGKVLTAAAGATTWALALPAQTTPSLLFTNGSTASWAGALSGNSGKFLTTDGSTVSWALPLPAQSVASILYSNGSTASWAAGLSGNAGKFLTNDGTSLSWATAQWTQIGVATVSSGSSAAFTGIATTYKDLLLVFEGVDPNGGSLTLNVGDATPSYSVASITIALSNSNAINGAILVPNVNNDYGTAILGVAGNTTLGSSPVLVAAAPATNSILAWRVTGGIRALRVSNSGTFNGGTIRLMGR